MSCHDTATRTQNDNNPLAPLFFGDTQVRIVTCSKVCSILMVVYKVGLRIVKEWIRCVLLMRPDLANVVQLPQFQGLML